MPRKRITPEVTDKQCNGANALYVPEESRPTVSQHIALYTRVSTEDQAERSTIQAQRDFLRNYAQVFGLSIVDEYADDGVTGTIPLSARPGGNRLLEDAKEKRFGCVPVYRVDRLGRSLTALLEAHNELAQASITVRSATEPFDTGTPIGWCRETPRSLGRMTPFHRRLRRGRTPAP
ncbi:recombinase family protein [Candidatus Entotheonella palauensis]|uniref:recombinase family protein n=1 Tax=Candidatus Entotheonella palauensis TaxID=93172 RepID=UPI0015C41DF5